LNICNPFRGEKGRIEMSGKSLISLSKFSGVKMAVKGRPQQVIRVAQTDLDASKPVKMALLSIKGIGTRLGGSLLRTLDINPDQKLSEIPSEKLKQLEGAIENPKHAGMPVWMLNRRKDPVTGGDVHLLSAKLDFSRTEDINLMQKIKSYKGVRHAAGLPVRGQKTRTSFRGKTTVGVVRKGITQAAKPAAAAAPAKGAAPVKGAAPAAPAKQEKK
jgi:small subunit ribosomal protein S13